MAVEAAGNDLVQVVALLAAGVVAVPIFKRLGLGSMLGYLTHRKGVQGCEQHQALEQHFEKVWIEG